MLLCGCGFTIQFFFKTAVGLLVVLRTSAEEQVLVQRRPHKFKCSIDNVSSAAGYDQRVP